VLLLLTFKPSGRRVLFADEPSLDDPTVTLELGGLLVELVFETIKQFGILLVLPLETLEPGGRLLLYAVFIGLDEPLFALLPETIELGERHVTLKFEHRETIVVQRLEMFIPGGRLLETFKLGIALVADGISRDSPLFALVAETMKLGGPLVALVFETIRQGGVLLVLLFEKFRQAGRHLALVADMDFPNGPAKPNSIALAL